jgi:hypothetical protein
MKNYRIKKQVKTLFSGETIELNVEGDNKDELAEVMNDLMPDPFLTRLFARRKRK